MKSSTENSSAAKITGYLLIIITLVYYCIIFDHHRDLEQIRKVVTTLEQLGRAFGNDRVTDSDRASDLPVSLLVSGPFFVIIALCDIYAVLYLLHVSSNT
jgi:hypothetical protein